MPIQTVTQRRNAALGYTGAATHGTVFTTAGPYTSAGTEPTGGSPAFARRALTWTGAADVLTATPTAFDIPSGTTIQGAGLFTALTGGTYLDGSGVTSQTFSSQGTYAVTYTYTQT